MMDNPRDVASLAFNYFNEKTTAINVSVFNVLNSVTLSGRRETPPIVRINDDDGKGAVQQLWKNVKAAAIYQLNKNGTTAITRTDIWADIEAGDNKSCEGSLTSPNLNLPQASSKYAKDKSLTKTRVTFTTGGVSKYDDIEIGAVGY
jgi:hypothetical protein